MDYHIVTTAEQSKNLKRQSQKDWHFEAQLFGAGILFLLLPLVAFSNPAKNDTQVLGSAVTSQEISTRVYDSEIGYYDSNETLVSDNDNNPSFVERAFSLLHSL